MNANKFRFWANVPGAIPCQVARVLPERTCDQVSQATLTRGAKNVLLCDKCAYRVGRMGFLPKRYKTEVIVKKRRVTHRTSERSNLEREIEDQQQTIDELNAMIDRLLDHDEERRRRPQSPDDEGFIYILRVGGCYKIGWTSDLKRRMKQYHPDTTLMCVYPGTRADEKKLHKRWGHHLRHGREWFVLAPEIDRHIEQMIAKRGKPEKVDCSAKLRAA